MLQHQASLHLCKLFRRSGGGTLVLIEDFEAVLPTLLARLWPLKRPASPGVSCWGDEAPLLELLARKVQFQSVNDSGILSTCRAWSANMPAFRDLTAEGGE